MERVQALKQTIKTLHNFKVIRLDGTTYDLYREGILVNGLTVPDPEPEHHDEPIEGMHGHFNFGTDLKGRELQGRFTLLARDHYDYELLRNKAFKIFDSREPFYIVRDLEPGKRLLVKKSGPIIPERDSTAAGEFAVGFISESAFFESIGTTLDPRTFESDLWQWGQGLPLEEIRYRHTASDFIIYNAGDEIIDPGQEKTPLTITIKGIAGGSFTLRNRTTGDVYTFRGGMAAGDTLELIGVRTLKNGSSAFADTNMNIIRLAPGRNEFTVTGLTSREITFDFRFYYL